MALGCTVGQAITGVSTLALGSFLTFAAIVAGGFYGLRVLERDRVNGGRRPSNVATGCDPGRDAWPF